MKRLLLAIFLLIPLVAVAQANLEINTPNISAIKSSMQKRHAQLLPHYVSGAVGLTADGGVAVRDAKLIALPQRQAVLQALAAENQDRGALYREIAVANNNPAWEADIRNTFAQRWIEKASAGWFYQNASGAWVKK